TFTDFPNLEHLDLRSNYLGDWLSQSPNEFQFGAAIRTIHLKNNDLDFDTQLAIETVRNFLYNLKRKPNFRSLFVDDIHFPEDMQYLVMERYLVLQEQQ
ncbi:Leucine Rich Repeat protein, partial [Candida maltosa Xu316]